MIADSVNPTIIFTFLNQPFQWLLERFAGGFSGFGLTAAIGAFGLAVIALTLLIRAVLFPIFAWQLRTSRRIQREQRLVAPQLQELRKKYKGQPQKLSAEMNKVYREHGISPFSGLTGCLPLLVQMPVLIGLYQAILNATHHIGQSDKGFLWISDLSKSAHDLCCKVDNNWLHIFSTPGVLVLPLVAAALTFVQSRMMMPQLRPDMTDQERSMARVSKQMSLFFPVIIILFSLNFPQGLALYWVTGTLFMVVQQYLVVGWGGLRVPAWLPGAGRTTSLSLPAPALVGPAKTQGAASDGSGKATASVADKNGKNVAGVPAQGADGKDRARTAVAARQLSRQARARRKRRR